MSVTTTHLLKDVSPLCWPVSGLTELLSSPSQVLVQGSQWRVMKADCKPKTFGVQSSVLPLRGQRRLKITPGSADFVLLPVELQHVNHAASTNGPILSAQLVLNSTIAFAMTNTTQTSHITERVERLLLRYEELRRTNALLTEEVTVLTLERDSLRSRLGAARSRVDALLERLPENASHSQTAALRAA